MREILSVVQDGMRIDWDVTIQVDDGSVLLADVFRPNDDGRDPARNVPSLMSRVRSPYAPAWGGLQRLLG